MKDEMYGGTRIQEVVPEKSIINMDSKIWIPVAFI
jgi:hypothetical protein